MKSLNNPSDRADLIRRLRTVKPDAKGQFGTLTAPRMITHLIDSSRMAMGEIEGLRTGMPVLSWPPFKQLLLYVLPIPKARAKTAPQLLATNPTEIAEDVEGLCGLMERFGEPDTRVGATHPAFGSMTRLSWGILAYKHSEAGINAMPANQQHLYRNMPLWVNVVFAGEVFGGALGSVGLLLRKKWALPLFAVSILGVLCQTFHIYFRSDAISVMGAPAVVMPLVAILIGAGMIVLTKSAIAKGWLR